MIDKSHLFVPAAFAGVGPVLPLEVVHGLEEDVEAREEAPDLHRQQRAALTAVLATAEVGVDQALELLK